MSLDETLDASGRRAAAFDQWKRDTEGWSANGDGMQRLAFYAGWRARRELHDTSTADEYVIAEATREASTGDVLTPMTHAELEALGIPRMPQQTGTPWWLVGAVAVGIVVLAVFVIPQLISGTPV